MRIAIVILLAAQSTVFVACSSSRAAKTGMNDHSTSNAMTTTVAQSGTAATASQAMVDRDLERLRAATASFKSLDAAVAAGYQRTVTQCISHPTLGVMGYHHTNDALLDDKLDVEHPEILVYGKTATGEYKLNGVEFFVPYSAHPRDSAPPEIMGQQLTPFDPGKFWYKHVWAWTENPSGMFADWNPNVKC